MACQLTYSQDFITHWSFFDESTAEIQFSSLTTDTVHFAWTASPSGNSGSGSFIQTTPDSVTLNGLNIESGDTLTLNMASDNLSRFYFENEQDQERLIDVSQWGDVEWTSMHKTFAWAFNLIVTATDTPDLSKVTDMGEMFAGASSFNQFIGDWDVSQVTNMRGMFLNAFAFNQNIGSWDVSNVTDMSLMFWKANNFNQDIGGWDVSNVTDINHMFGLAKAFNQYIGDWNVSNVTDMRGLFRYASNFNQNIGAWDVSNVTDMSLMFWKAINFNQDIGDWDVSNVLDMSSMFLDASSFNQYIGNWDVSNVADMQIMFWLAHSFNQYIGNWKLRSDVKMSKMLDSSGMDCDHYSATLVGWQRNNPSVNGIRLGAEGMEYGTSAEAARDSLINV